MSREKLIRVILDIFNIILFCKNQLFIKVFKNSTKNNYQKEEHVKAVRYKFVIINIRKLVENFNQG